MTLCNAFILFVKCLSTVSSADLKYKREVTRVTAAAGVYFALAAHLSNMKLMCEASLLMMVIFHAVSLERLRGKTRTGLE